MTILSSLEKKEIWEEFYQYKNEKFLLTNKEKEELREFIDKEQYKNIAKEIIQGIYKFSIPQKILINKIDKSKKRAVYVYKFEEMMILKLLAHLLYKYDYLFPSNCYSFRQNYGVKQAIYNLKNKYTNDLYGYKIDIANYFNSIPTQILLPKLKDFFKSDINLYKLMEQILTNNEVYENGNIIKEEKGIMAGVPISSFLANFYLMDIDKYFATNDILYARYSDDIILFGNEENIKKYISDLKRMIKEHGLSLNEKKEKFFMPKEKWEFLGFSFENGVIDLSEIAIKKVKGKIKRSARSLRRWMLRKNAKSERALKAMNIKFNRKFYTYFVSKDLSWVKWYFPIIQTSKGLNEIDLYMQQELRYIVTGKHNKKNYQKVPYAELKRCYYRPLVKEFYEFKKNK